MTAARRIDSEALDRAIQRGMEKQAIIGLRVKVRHYEGEALRLAKLLEATRKQHRRERGAWAFWWFGWGVLVGVCGAALLAVWA